MHPISEILFRVYEVLYSRGQVSFLLTQQNKDAVDSVVKTVNSEYFGLHRYPSKEDRAVAYLCLLIKRHALTDGNKRTALLWFDIYCDVEGLHPNEPDFGYDALAVTIESVPPDEIEDFMATVKDLLF